MAKDNSDRYEILCSTEQGYVLRCPGCGGIRLRFRNVVLDLAQDDIAALRDVINQVIAEEHDTVLYVGASQSRLVFTASDVAILKHLLVQAGLLLDLNDNALSLSLQASDVFAFPPTLGNRIHAST